MVISEKGCTKIIKLSKSRGDINGAILRSKKITYKKILCIFVETIEVLLRKIFFASKDTRLTYTNI